MSLFQIRKQTGYNPLDSWENMLWLNKNDDDTACQYVCCVPRFYSAVRTVVISSPQMREKDSKRFSRQPLPCFLLDFAFCNVFLFMILPKFGFIRVACGDTFLNWLHVNLYFAFLLLLLLMLAETSLETNGSCWFCLFRKELTRSIDVWMGQTSFQRCFKISWHFLVWFVYKQLWVLFPKIYFIKDIKHYKIVLFRSTVVNAEQIQFNFKKLIVFVIEFL